MKNIFCPVCGFDGLKEAAFGPGKVMNRIMRSVRAVVLSLDLMEGMIRRYS